METAAPPLLALFASAFLSATLLPGNSELVLLHVVRTHPESLAAALGIATFGNTLGSLTTYLIGRLVPQRAPRERALAWLQRHGSWALLLAWLPFIGDALCAAAGWLRWNVLACTAAIAAGKLARYLVVAQVAALL